MAGEGENGQGVNDQGVDGEESDGGWPLHPLPAPALDASPPPHEALAVFKAGSDNGWKRAADGATAGTLDHPPWMTLRSDNAPGAVRLARTLPPVHYALHAASHVMRALRAEGHGVARVTPDGAALVFADLSALHAACRRAWHLARSLPDAPLDDLAARLAREGIEWSGPAGNDLNPGAGEAAGASEGGTGATTREATVRLRVGQDAFRRALDDYWNGRCPLTGITDRALLRASHIVPWRNCASDAERLDVHNGLLLAAHWDAAFDAGLVTFDDGGRAVPSPALSAEARAALALDAAPALRLAEGHRPRLARHRRNTFRERP